MKSLYPEIEPYKIHQLRVSPIHELYLEEVGNPQGRPILFLHGGPGAGITTKHRRFFDPKHYRILLFDQRGSGKSTPHASLVDNTTSHLIEDIEAIREYLGIKSWIVFGGSWGSTLALAYAQAHPQKVDGLILRGIFLCRPEELAWFYQAGAHWIFPEEWENYVSRIKEGERSDLIKAYYHQLTSENPDVAMAAAKAWSRWEGSALKLIPDAEAIATFTGDHMALAIARIECHYFVNQAFMKPNQLLEGVDIIRSIPSVIVHGRYDIVCPVKNAIDLHRAWPEAKLRIIADAGHAADEPGILIALVEATNEFRALGSK